MVDRYTKAVLTVIAVALVWLCLWGPGPATLGTPAEGGTVSRPKTAARPSAAGQSGAPLKAEVVNWDEAFLPPVVVAGRVAVTNWDEASLWPLQVTGNVTVDEPLQVRQPVEVTGTVAVRGVEGSLLQLYPIDVRPVR